MQQDTLFGEMERPLTQNLYVYCLNNGVNLRDPSGNASLADLRAQYERAQNAGAGASVLAGIQAEIDKLLRQPGPAPTQKEAQEAARKAEEARRKAREAAEKAAKAGVTGSQLDEMNNIANNIKPSTPWNDSGSSSNGTVSNPGANLTPSDVGDLFDRGAALDEQIEWSENLSTGSGEEKARIQKLKDEQKRILWLLEGYYQANPNLSAKDMLAGLFPSGELPKITIDWDSIGTTALDVLKKAGLSIYAVVKGAKLELELGYGLGIGGGIENILSAEATAKYNSLKFELGNGEVFWGEEAKAGFSGSIPLYDTELSSNYKHNDLQNGCICDTLPNFLIDQINGCPNWVNVSGIDTDSKISLGASGYLVYGGGASIEYNFTYVYNELKNIWGVSDERFQVN